MKKLAALGLAGLAAAMLTVASGSASADKWDHNYGSQPHVSGSWPHPSGSWPHPSGPGPSTWPHNGGQSWNHDHRPHHGHGGPWYYGGGPGPYYNYDDGDDYYGDDYYDYPSYPIYDDAHVRWCASHYRTYNPATDRFFIRAGVLARCIAPFDR